jgi:hypothetical protein
VLSALSGHLVDDRGIPVPTRNEGSPRYALQGQPRGSVGHSCLAGLRERAVGPLVGARSGSIGINRPSRSVDSRPLATHETHGDPTAANASASPTCVGTKRALA